MTSSRAAGQRQSSMQATLSPAANTSSTTISWICRSRSSTISASQFSPFSSPLLTRPTSSTSTTASTAPSPKATFTVTATISISALKISPMLSVPMPMACLTLTARPMGRTWTAQTLRATWTRASISRSDASVCLGAHMSTMKNGAATSAFTGNSQARNLIPLPSRPT